MRHYALCFATWLLHKFSTGEIETSSAPSLYMFFFSFRRHFYPDKKNSHAQGHEHFFQNVPFFT
jgi:hypothetical protein